MTLGCSCAFFSNCDCQVVLAPPDTIKVNFQKTVFTALRSRGKDNRTKNRSLDLVLERDNCGQMYYFFELKESWVILAPPPRYN